MRKLFVSDLDGTLLNGEGVLSPFTEHTLRELIKQGLCFTVASARTPLSAGKLFEQVPLFLPMILLNGALLFDPGSQTVLDSVPLTERQRHLLQGLEQQQGLVPLRIEQAGDKVCCLLDHMTEVWRQFLEKHQLPCPQKSQASSCKEKILYLIYADSSPLRLEQMARRLKAAGSFTVDFYQDAYLAQTWFLEVCSDAASKGNALQWLRAFCRAEQIVCFGDGVNDLSLFANSDLSCAVSNAGDALRQRADRVIGSNAQDGVAHFLLESWENESTLL